MTRPLGTWDYVIVGAGTAGCVLANRLSADPDVTVLLARSGRQGRLDLDPHPGRLPLLHRQSAHRLVLPHRARSGPQRALDPLRARQGPRRLLVDQRDAVSPRPAARLRRVGAPHRRRRVVVVERAAGVQALGRPPRRRERHALGGGEWRVERQRLSWEVLDSFREAMAQAGIPKVEDFNGGDNEGGAFFEVNQRRGVRWSAAKGFLKPAMGRPNLTVMTDVHANRIRLDGRRAGRRRAPTRRRGRLRRSAASRRSSRRARSARRRSSSSRASGRRRCCRSTASRWRTRSPASARTSRTTSSSAWRSR